MIKQHATNRNVEVEFEAASRKFEKFNDKIKIALNTGKAVNLSAFMEMGLRLATYSAVVGNAETFKSAMTSSLQAGKGHFRMEFTDGEYTSVEYGGEQFNVPTSNKKVKTSLFDFWSVLDVAMILRDETVKSELLEMREAVDAKSGDPFWRRSMDLILMCLGEKAFQDKVIDNIRSIARSGFVEFHTASGSTLVNSEEGRAIREALWVPITELYYHAMSKNPAAFNKRLEKFLLDKKEWIVKKGEHDDSRYWVDMPLLACCSYAHDNGILIAVKSEYIPSNIYNGKFNAKP